MTTSVLLRSAVLLAILVATFATAAVSENDDLIFDPEKAEPVEIPLIERHRQSTFFHRVKRQLGSWWDSFVSPGEPQETTTTSAPEDPVDEDVLESGQQENLQLNEPEEQLGLSDWDNKGEDLASENYVEETSSLERKRRESEETGDVTPHPNAIDNGIGDDEDLDGSGEVDGSADGPTDEEAPRILYEPAQNAVPKPHPAAEEEKPSSVRRNIYRVSLVVNEPYRASFADRNNPEFKKLSNQLTTAINDLYEDKRSPLTGTKILNFQKTGDPVATLVSLDLDSTSSNENAIRTIFADQLDLHTLGGITVRPDSFNFRNMQGIEGTFTATTEESTIPQTPDSTTPWIETGSELVTDNLYLPVSNSNERRIDEADENYTVIGLTDESFSTTTEKSTEVRCRGDDVIYCRDRTQCISSVQKCDGNQDCDDNSDEEGCPRQDCNNDEFACDVSRCIRYEQKCDFQVDCDDGSDEHDCPKPPECSANQFTCRNGQCIRKDSLCDGTSDCFDQSDEANCQSISEIFEQHYIWPVDNRSVNGVYTGNTTITTSELDPVPRWPFNFGYCPIGRWPCRNGKQCIPVWQRCDKEPHCDDLSDEDKCDVRICHPETEWTCRNGRCIERNLKCNGLDDCGDRSDEQTCPCTKAQFMCGNGYCIPKERRCDNFNDCQDKTDEMDCVTTTPSCSDNEFKCASRDQCIDNSLVCNNVPDCADSSDERDCPVQVCSSDQFRCNDGTCLSGSLRCDDNQDCAGGEDEEQCGCGVAEFHCMDGSCIPENLVCDRSDDCPDGSDEGCDPCKLRSTSFNDLTRCWMQLNIPSCESLVNASFPPLETFHDGNSKCKNVIHKDILRNYTARTDERKSNTETWNSRENTIDTNEDFDPDKDVEVLQIPIKSSDTDRSQEVELRNTGKHNSWEYVQSTSKGRFKKRPKLRPEEQKLFDEAVKRCRIKCLRLWTKQKHGTEFGDSVEMKVKKNRDRKTIDCLEIAKNRTDEDNCFNVNAILRSQLLSHLRKNKGNDRLEPETRSGNEYDGRRRMARGVLADRYFEKYKILEKFTPPSTKSTTATTSGVNSVTEEIHGNTGSIWTHEYIRSPAPMEIIYHNKCKFSCEEFYVRLYDGKSNENNGQIKSDEEDRTTTKGPSEVSHESGNSISNEIDSWLISSNEDKTAKSRSRESSSSPEAGQSYEKNEIEVTTESNDLNNEWEYIVPSHDNSIERNYEGTNSKEHKSRSDRKKDKKKRKGGRKKTIAIETTTQTSTTTEEIEKAQCPEYHHSCDHGKCIKDSLVCNGKHDCADRSDEDDCEYSQVLKNYDYDSEYDEKNSKGDIKQLETTRSQDLQSTTEIYERKNVTEKTAPSSFNLGWFLGGGDGSKSTDKISTKTSSNRLETTTEKPWWKYGGGWGLPFGGSNDLAESSNSEATNQTTNQIEDFVEISKESDTDTKAKSKSERKRHKKKRKHHGKQATTLADDLQSSIEILTTTETNDRSKSGEDKSTESSWSHGGETLYDISVRKQNEYSIELTERSTDSKHKNTNDDKRNKKRRKGSHEKTTLTETTTSQISTTEDFDEERCPNDGHHCSEGKCVAYELICNGENDCEDHSDEDSCEYYYHVLKNFDYDESDLKNDDKETESFGNNDVQSTADAHTTTDAYERHTVAEKKDFWNKDYGFFWKNKGDFQPGKDKSSRTSTSHPETTTTRLSWNWENSWFGNKDDPKSKENEAFVDPSSKQKVNSEKNRWDFGKSTSSEKLDKEIGNKSKSKEKNSPLRVTSNSMSSSVDIIDNTSTTTTRLSFDENATDKSTTINETRRRKPHHEVTTLNPNVREEDKDHERNTWTNSGEKYGSVIRERLKENYNAYNMSFARPDNRPNWRGRGHLYRQNVTKQKVTTEKNDWGFESFWGGSGNSKNDASSEKDNSKSKENESSSSPSRKQKVTTEKNDWGFDSFWGGSDNSKNDASSKKDNSKSTENESTVSSSRKQKVTTEKNDWGFDSFWGGSDNSKNDASSKKDNSKSTENESTVSSSRKQKVTTEKNDWGFDSLWGGSGNSKNDAFSEKDNSKSKENESSSSPSKKQKVTTEKNDWGFDSFWGSSDNSKNDASSEKDNSKSKENESSSSPSRKQKVTTEKNDWVFGSSWGSSDNSKNDASSEKDNSKSKENESTVSSSRKQKVTTEKNDWGFGSFWGSSGNSKNDASSEKLNKETVEGSKSEERNSPLQVTSSSMSSSIEYKVKHEDEDLGTSTTTTENLFDKGLTDEPTTTVKAGRKKPQYDVTTLIPDVRKANKDRERNTWTNSGDKHSSVTRERLNENYNAYNNSFERKDIQENSWQEMRRQNYQRHLDSLISERLRQQQIRRQEWEEEQRRIRIEQEQDRRRDEIARLRWELARENYERSQELRRRQMEDLRRRNDERRWQSRTYCARGSRGCSEAGRLTEGVADCPSMDFTCGDGSCVPQSSVCNGIDDCPLAEDELHCEKLCGVSEFRCVKDGKCINAAYRCDLTNDCSDHSDEEGCPPRYGNSTGNGHGHGKPWSNGSDHTTDRNPGGEEGSQTTNIGVRECKPAKEFRCQNGQCILLRRKCDMVPDCYDSSDENDCSGRCNLDQWKCESQECIQETERCDGISHCVDGSDEIGCVNECPIGLFRCEDGLCLDGAKRCDGFPDCGDQSDEINCPCPVGEWPCSNGVCINEQFRCDSQFDCTDNSDEADCPPRLTCQDDEFRCSDGQCISKSTVCDGVNDCRDSEDERNCQRCSGDQFQCGNGKCIRGDQVCNRRNDCGDNSDEQNCATQPPPTPPPRPGFCLPGQDCDPETGCTANEWRCENGPCIPMNRRCDGRIDCPRDNSDELDCDNEVSIRCSSLEWRCENGPCIPLEKRCNGRRDCPRDNSDELDCPKIPLDPQRRLDLKTYPTDQVITEKTWSEGREVVIRCRDEGPIRAKVRWIREDGAPLPRGSTDVDGRLEMPNVQVIDSGNYVCEALGVPENMPGRRVISHLTVERETFPTPPVPKACQYDEATCSNGECIPKSNVCDGRSDCTDGSDELRCSTPEHGCEPNQFRCRNKECVTKIWRCDGDKDCHDGSDEENCTPSPPGSPCNYNEFQCASGPQCVLKTFHCDRENDCADGSDEFGCTKIEILRPPPRMVDLQVGELFEISCTAIGVPTPEISWRLNWGHIPDKCTTTSINGTGVLTCPKIAIEDQGAYSCEGINTLGWDFAKPDTILTVKRPLETVCPIGTFNSEAVKPEECISCFCFGVATQCTSADLFTYQLPAPFDQYNVVTVETYPDIKIRGEPVGNVPEVRPVGQNGVQVTDRYTNSGNPDSVLYFALPESYHGSQLKSYGGYLKYTVRYGGQGSPNSAPTVILTGNKYVLVHKGEDIAPDYETERTVRFFFGDWLKKEGWDEVPASREEIMMALANVDNILIKVKYDDGPIDTTITNVFMDTADVRNTNLGTASFVEECRCPVGYTGLSCENCAGGYRRRETGAWLGQCFKEEITCQPGYYLDPSGNRPCQKCPCPLTDPSNQFARTCHLGSDGQPTCDCPQGYIGRRCERCAPGYRGNPLIPNDGCVKVDECDPYGSLSPYVDPATGVCRCKELATGNTCNKCKPETFNLASTNEMGCVSCFCMGIVKKCTSSNWYRNKIRVAFTSSIRDFSLVESRSTDPAPIVDGIRLNQIEQEIVYESFPNRGTTDVYYWQVPSNFLGNQLASYGGNLTYTVRYVPSPGGGRSINNAADVELISSNKIHLRHYSGKQLEPNTAKTFSVPLLEGFWQRPDGRPTDREHLLMALADVLAIRIKATYTTHTEEAALSAVSLDTAINANTGNVRAVEVEECACPVGYKGLSCEDCDVGYTRSEGLYLGICVPCSCNGHGTQCHPETGVCEYCEDNTTGDYCDSCIDGYEGDATRGTPNDCQPQDNRTDEPCSCDPAGSLSNNCYNGQCECKTNVQGPRCDRCRPSTFGLSASSVDGCSECFCSGLTSQCHESSLYVMPIPAPIFDEDHGFTLTDSTRRDVIKDGITLHASKNQIGYRNLDSRNQRLFWSLPYSLTGDQVQSYGGKLYITQQIITRPGARNERDQDVLLVGNGITLYWTNPKELQSDIPLSYSVPLVESSWTRLTQEEGLHTASRTDLMTVLSHLEAILVRATHSSGMLATYISDVSLDTAVDQGPSDRRATQVEACRCPPGYTGYSCEKCATGHYRDISDTSRSLLGACNVCPCNGNEQECKLDSSGGVKCYCSPGFTGPYCNEPEYTTTPEPLPQTTYESVRIIVTIRENPIQIVAAGSTVTYHCFGRSVDTELLDIKWQKENGQLPPGRSHDDSNGILVIRDVKVSDSGIYVCQVSDGFNINIQKLSLTVGRSHAEKPRAIITPDYLTVEEGNPAEFRCEASGNPQPEVTWTRLQGEMNPAASFENGIWRIPSARKSDEAEYECIAQNSAGTSVLRTILYVTENSVDPDPQPLPIIDPADWEGEIGEVIQLRCSAPRDSKITWTKSGNAPLPASATVRDGVLTIYNPTPADSGYYICTSVTYRGVTTSSNARVTIKPSWVGPPIIRVEPDRQTVNQGTVAEVKCVTTGEPAPVVEWSRLGEETLAANIQIDGNTLRIINPQVSDRGIYVCRATNSGGTSQSSAIIEIERREPPVIQLYPEKSQSVRVDGSALLQCRVTEGIPTPSVKWARQDGRPFSSNVEQLPGGVLRFSHVSLEDGGSFVCSASNEAGSTSITAVLEISSPPVISLTPSTNPLSVKLGQRVRLTCSASGQPSPHVVWRKQSRNDHERRIVPENLESMAVYEISSVSYVDEGTYTCVATNSYGPVEERIQIRVEQDNWEGPDSPTSGSTNTDGGVKIGEDNPRIPIGGRLEIRCQVYGKNPEENIYVDWRRNDGRPLPTSSIVRDGTLFIPKATRNDAGGYTCRGLNTYGHTVFNATSYVEVINPPRIEMLPMQQTVNEGDSPIVECRTTGDQPMTIQWEALERPLPQGASVNGAFLKFNEIVKTDAGKYICTAINTDGRAVAVAEVFVNEYTVSYPQNLTEISTFVGASVQLECPTHSRTPINWSKEGGSLPRSSYIRLNTLELPNVRIEDSGRYICHVTRENGASISGYVDLRIELYGVRCSSNEFQCRSGECIDKIYLCDNFVDCIDGSDEQYCSDRHYRHYPQQELDRAAPVSVYIRPSQELVNIGDNIDVQCEVAGARDSQIRWTRPNQLALPPNSQVYGAILRLYNVETVDGGTYRCVAETSDGNFEKDYELIIQGGNNDAPAVETVSVPYGKSVVMVCNGPQSEPLTEFQWHKLGGHLPTNSHTHNNQIEIRDVKAEDAGTYICTANNGRVSVEVPKILVVTGVVPHFSQAPKSYLSFPPLPDALLQFKIEVSFKPESYEGIILYNGQSENGEGDFILLSLVGGYPEFRIDVGSGPAVIRGQRPINIGKWHTIKLQRDNKVGRMFVDGEGPYTGTAPGKFQKLDLLLPLYVGGVPDYNAISRQANMNSGFVGCISRLVVGENQHDLIADPLSTVGVTTCETCAENPCTNNGVCQEAFTEQGYTCLCPAGYSGKHCSNIRQACYPDACGEGRCIDGEDGFVCKCPIGKGGSKCELDVNVSEPEFNDRHAYLGYNTPKALRRIKLGMKFKPSDVDNGILMYCSESNDGLGDFIALIIKDRHVEFRFDFGSGMAVVRSNHIIQPGKWLRLQASRDIREGKLSVNNEPLVIGRSPGPVRSMNLNTLLYIGGVNRHKVTVNKNVGVDSSFRGCISELDIAGQSIDILRSVVDSSNIKDCVVKYSDHTEPPIYKSTPVPTRPPTSPATTSFNPCASSPCIHGSCQVTHTGDYSCICEYGYVGRNCENVLKQCELLPPCKNGGTCTDLHGAFKCDCQFGFNGYRCETPVEISNDVAFRGDGWLELERSVMTHEEEKEVLGFEISTNKSTGVIMWHGQTPTDLSPDDYISLAVVDGYVEYQYNLGSGPAVIRVTAQRVDDGGRHRIVLKRQGSEGSIELNGEHTESGASDGLQQLLNARGSVYLGGVPDYAMTYGRYQDGFSGCIYTLEVQDSGAIVIGDKAIRGKNVYPCTSDEIDRPPIRGDGGYVQR